MSAAIQFKLRTNEWLHLELRQRAKENGRSLNAEIQARLDQSLREDRIETVLSAILKKINRLRKGDAHG